MNALQVEMRLELCFAQGMPADRMENGIDQMVGFFDVLSQIIRIFIFQAAAV